MTRYDETYARLEARPRRLVAGRGAGHRLGRSRRPAPSTPRWASMAAGFPVGG